MRGATITTITTITETCSGGSCTQVSTEQVTLSFTANEMWAALGIAAREAGVDVSTLIECYLGAGLSLAGYQLADQVAA